MAMLNNQMESYKGIGVQGSIIVLVLKWTLLLIVFSQESSMDSSFCKMWSITDSLGGFGEGQWT